MLDLQMFSGGGGAAKPNKRRVARAKRAGLRGDIALSAAMDGRQGGRSRIKRPAGLMKKRPAGLKKRPAGLMKKRPAGTKKRPAR